MTARADGKVVSFRFSETVGERRGIHEGDVAGSVLRHAGAAQGAQRGRFLELGLPQSAGGEDRVGACARRSQEGPGAGERQHDPERAHQKRPGGSSV